MKKRLLTSISLLFAGAVNAQNRFPKPDFESGYQYPDITYPVPDEMLWTAVDIVVLIALMSFAAWAVIRKQARRPVIWTSIVSVAYFGFFRKGCICSIGSIQNITLALADNTYVLPLSVLLFFILPIVFAFLFGRVFCAGVCPFGALQELVNVKNFKLSRSLAAALEVIPWIYLIFAVLYAATRSSFIICRFDPFIGIFRLGGDITLIAFGVVLLIAAVFTGRPFCRFICPYGVLLSLFARVSVWKVQITPRPCINCDLCRNACPVDAIRPPYENKVKESRGQGVKRILGYFALLFVLIVAGALLMRAVSGSLSRGNKDVRLYDMVVQHEADPQNVLSLELEAFYGQGGTVEEITQRYEHLQSLFRLYATIAGGLIGLVIGMALLRLSLKRTRKQYEINHAACVACGGCFSYCPQNKPGGESENPVSPIS